MVQSGSTALYYVDVVLTATQNTAATHRSIFHQLNILRLCFKEWFILFLLLCIYSPFLISFSSVGSILCLANQENFNCKQNTIVRLAIVINLYLFTVDDFLSYFYLIFSHLEFKVNKKLLINIYVLANCIIFYYSQIIYANIFCIKIWIAMF